MKRVFSFPRKFRNYFRVKEIPPPVTVSDNMTDPNNSIIYGLEFQSRCLCSFVSTEITFLAGTQSLKGDNYVHKIVFDDEGNALNKSIFPHPDGEIWHLSSSPFHEDIIATVHQQFVGSKANQGCTVFKLNNNDGNCTTDKQFDLNCPDKQFVVSKTQWHPADSACLLTLAETTINFWDIDVAKTTNSISSTTKYETKSAIKFSAAEWYPHSSNSQVGAAIDNSVQFYDARDPKVLVSTIDHAHGQMIRDINFNVNKTHTIATCGDDCYVKIWDMRKKSEPLVTMSEHGHWVWSVRFNPLHDSLILSCSSDSRVILHRIASVSSEVNDLERQKDLLEDCVVKYYEDHEDSVYAAEWSHADPWTFASLSYDGRLVINRVPNDEKWKYILD